MGHFPTMSIYLLKIQRFLPCSWYLKLFFFWTKRPNCSSCSPRSGPSRHWLVDSGDFLGRRCGVSGLVCWLRSALRSGARVGWEVPWEVAVWSFFVVWCWQNCAKTGSRRKWAHAAMWNTLCQKQEACKECNVCSWNAKIISNMEFALCISPNL